MTVWKVTDTRLVLSVCIDGGIDGEKAAVEHCTACVFHIVLLLFKIMNCRRILIALFIINAAPLIFYLLNLIKYKLLA